MRGPALLTFPVSRKKKVCRVRNRRAAMQATAGLVAGTFLLALTACSHSIAVRQETPPPFIPIERQYLQLPEDVSPMFPTFAPGGGDIVFQNAGDSTSWIVRPDGSELQCIDCDFPDRPPAKRSGGFVYAFSDGRRLLLTRGLGKQGGGESGADADAWVLECTPSLRDCATHRFLDVDMSADRGQFSLIHRRFWHLAPDEEHLGWMNVRADGTVMVVARLERREDRYVAVDPRAVNPSGPVDAQDDRADRWETFSQLYELKGFTPDGKSMLAVGLPGHNIDVLRIDLASGGVTRLTADPDWDEDSSLSPDQSLFVVNSWRGRDRFDVFSWIPQIRGFTGLVLGAALATPYVSTWSGFQCNLSPWLLPATGDDGGRLQGQPLDTYGDDLTAAANVSGRYVWSPDSTRVLLSEKTRVPPPGQQIPNRIAVARLLREPTQAVAVSSSRVGNWAPPAAQYAGPHATERTVVVRGNRGGTATLEFSGSLGKNATTSVIFERFTDDGRSFVDGTMDVSSLTGRWKLAADVRVSGEHDGSLEMDLKLDNAAKPLPLKEGTITAIYDGKPAPALPNLGPCYEKLPRPSPLRLDLSQKGNQVHAAVTADIDGDVRPVAGALVQLGQQSARTGVSGMARIDGVDVSGQVTATAVAGDTFAPATASLAR